jgi:divalent metal cation (Fe/Co/Zn/Cd) transporter
VTEHDQGLQSALRVSYATIVWSTLSGIVSLLIALRVASLALAGVGASVLVDEVSSIVLVWRFRKQRGGGGAEVDAAEARALRIAAVGLVLVGLSLIGSGIEHLVASDSSHPDAAALAAAGASVVVLPMLARWKYAAAAAVQSAALRTDAHITVVGAGTAAMTLIGLGLTALFGWHWADAAAAVGIGLVASYEGRAALTNG